MPSKRIVKTLLNNRVSRRFFDAAPSVNEFVILDRIRDYIDGVKGDYEYVLVDLPASGHAVTFLSVPRLLSDMIRVGKVADRADKVDAMVNDVDKTGILAVCMPEQMPVNETIDLSNNLEETLGRTLDGVFLNLFHRAPFDLTYRDSFQAAYKGVTDESRRGALYGETTPIQKLFEGNALALDWHERDQSYVEKLHNGLDGTRVFQIPVVYQIEGETVVDNVAEHIDAIRGQQ